jgi:thiamine kinase-like enzyme
LSNIRIYSSFISEDLEGLLFEICNKERKKEVHVAPFNRFGFSGSNLYLIFFSKEKKKTNPRLLKTIKNKQKAETEKKAMDDLEYNYIHTRHKYYSTEKLYGISLEYHGDDVANNFDEAPKTLKDILYGEKTKEIMSNGKICNLIKTVFKDFRKVYDPVDKDNCSISESYSKYLRGNKTKDIIKNLTKSNIDDKKIDFYGQKITNPVYIMNNLLEQKIPMTKSFIHGDLHPDNIVINHQNFPRIIDFAWSTENDIYIDFSLLEMSVRYWGIPFFTNKVLKDKLEERTLKEVVDIRNVDLQNLNNKKIQRMMLVANEIRSRCKEITGKKYNFKSHLLSQFIVLYGLQKFDDKYNPFIVIPFLGKLGEKLIDFGYVENKKTLYNNGKSA